MQLSVEEVKENREEWMPLLLLADPEETMVEKYLHQGIMVAVYGDGEPAGVIIAVPLEGGREWEIKNVAVAPRFWRRGIGTLLIEEVERRLPKEADTLWVGTGGFDSGPFLFYEECGFQFDHVLENFFVDNYPEPIIDEGEQCVDMYYLKKTSFRWG
ncbi:GNAT family N-acetyltransferase [Zongyangia hominis]|uniref:GNAT family N-acetyltransferase n=1 Tax=Zongyangia hominis TaxID=2763677 RepID=A0A926IBP7_9FIRM|nr:GNAT family N-acetyltransferase [Zongyangia hominis]MBC8570315.1 GNAT family N-acetyltransferase [Zongyangia hominis]